ncbi:MAG: hypothetical protein KatS3mg077_1515 [Candidatus Binatia bacterium]|nr:MAG: hypothetical protein KatS3mg077_1515 [Candidatus Binatia bacterium]
MATREDKEIEAREGNVRFSERQRVGTVGASWERGSATELDKLRAELDEARQELDYLLCALAHDLRAPLRHAEAFAMLLRREMQAGGSTAEFYLDGLSSALIEMRQLMESLLMVCRAGHASPDREQVQLGEIAREIVEKLSRRSPERQVEFTVRGDLAVQADPRLTYLLLHALLENAWKYSRSRPVTVIEIGEQHRQGQRVFYVRDRGIGFPQEKAEEIFVPLRRLHPSREFEGVGLGLSLARRVVARHGGRIWAEGRPGEGACFYFTLDE